MMKVESTGKNIEQAIQNGLAELRVSKDDVEIKILEKGGLFKKAKVLLIVDAEIEQQLKNREKNIQELEEKLQANNLEKEDEELQKNDNEQENIENEETEKISPVAKSVVSFVKSVCALQNCVVKADVKENKDDIEITLSGDNANNVIGYRGEGLNSLQYLANIVASRTNKNCPRIYINVGNFKEERQQSLIKLARRMAVKVAKTKQSIKLEPMTAYERKIVHSALQNDSYVKTYSVGEEPKRCLVIDLK